ncbi:MAG: Asp-tRNA(Asn)/Glu-tRNA(Gln) amidotransferase subunit GatC [bacterium]|nr:Asp-tRNA(Asn)/Glu-tRNA(Gln) amidotransferase subunit GatC [bacterium]
MISKEEVKKIADLARLHLSDKETTGYSLDISGVLENFETIRSLDTTSVVALEAASGLQNVTREDVVRENILGTPEELLKKTKTKDGYVVVKAVFTEAEVL